MARIWTSASDKISEKIKKARRTGRLDLSAVGITELPEDILTLRSLRSINLSHNSIKVI
jgi:Leucine-rich repeat (LRR) protein